MPLILRGRLVPASLICRTVPVNSALVRIAVELHLNTNRSLTAKFDGEFATSAQTCGGSGTLKYSW